MKESEDGLSVLLDELGLLVCALGVNFLVNAIAWVLHADDIGSCLVTDLLNKRLRQADVFTVRMEMNYHLLRAALDEHAWNEVFSAVRAGVFLELLELFEFMILLPLLLEELLPGRKVSILLLQGLDILYVDILD